MGNDLDTRVSPQNSEPNPPATPSTGFVPPFLTATQRSSTQEHNDESEPLPLLLEGSGPLPVPEENSERAVMFDEAAALRSLDDTIMRPGPDANTIWAEEDSWIRDNEPEPMKLHLPLVALVVVVAVISFVAGGVAARLSSQIPVLIDPKPAPVESVAEYREVTPVKQDEDDTLTKPAPQMTEPGDSVEDTRNETTDTTDEQDSDRHRYSYPTPQAPVTTDDQSTTDEQTTTDDTHTYQWNFDNEGDRSISYDTDSDKVTLDYDGYSFTVDLDGLLSDNGYGTETTYDPYGSNRPESQDYSDSETTYYDPWQWLAPTVETNNGTTDQQTTDDYTTYRYYDYDTTNDTDQNRDTMTWNDRSNVTPWAGGLRT